MSAKCVIPSSTDQIIEKPTPLEKLIGAILAIRIGDAMGKSWEMMSRKEIMFATRNAGVTGFSKNRQTKIVDTIYLEPQDPSDDWYLNRAMLMSLIRSHGFNLHDCVKCHLYEFENAKCGFGYSHTKNLELLKELNEGSWKTPGSLALSQAPQPLGKGSGNGVAIKTPALAIFFHDQPEEFFDALNKIARITHRDAQAMTAAFAFGRLIAEVYEASVGFCTKQKLQLQIQELIDGLINEVGVREMSLFGGYTQFYVRLVEVGKLVHSGQINNLDKVRETLGCSYKAYESVPLAIAMFLANPTDFRTAMLETINSGGDTDSNAAMVGALVGANMGAMAIPEEWRTYHEDFEEAGDLAVALHNVMNNVITAHRS